MSPRHGCVVRRQLVADQVRQAREDHAQANVAFIEAARRDGHSVAEIADALLVDVAVILALLADER